MLRFHNDDITGTFKKMKNLKENGWICLIVALSVGFLLGVDARPSPLATDYRDSTGVDSVCYYYYDYPLDDGHSNDNIIELVYRKGLACDGYFWGTSDEFDTAREGYYTGHFVLRMQQLDMHGDTLCFVLDSRGRQYLSAPVDVAFHSVDEALAHGAYLWMQESKYFQDSIPYKATFANDGLMVLCYRPESLYNYDRHFLRMSIAEIKNINRKVPWEEENSVLIYERDSLLNKYEKKFYKK